MKTPFGDRNPFWGMVGGFIAVVLTVIAATKHDLRWLLIFAWPFAVGALWMAMVSTKRPALCTSISSGVVGLFLFWMGLFWLAPGDQFRVSIGVGDDESAWNRYFFYSYSEGSLGKTISPINVFMVAEIVNSSPYPIRITGYSARIKKDDGWFTSWQQATVVTGGTVVMSAGNDAYKLTLGDMKTVVPSLPMLSFLSEGQSQIEAGRRLQGWFALEYPDHLVAQKNHKIELEVVSDVAGVAHGTIDFAKVKDPHDPTSVTTTPTALNFPQVLNLSGAKFMYWSDIQQQLKASR